MAYVKYKEDKSLQYSPAQATTVGLSQDGGLFLPVTTPKLPADALKKNGRDDLPAAGTVYHGDVPGGLHPLRSWASMRKGLWRINSTQLTWPLRKVDDDTYAWSCGMALPAHLRIWPCNAASPADRVPGRRIRRKRPSAFWWPPPVTPERPHWRDSGMWKRPKSWSSTPRMASVRFSSCKWPPRREQRRVLPSLGTLTMRRPA